jgi:hypothetical protein
MRENRPYGSEGGEAKSFPYPYRRSAGVALGASGKSRFGPSDAFQSLNIVSHLT